MSLPRLFCLLSLTPPHHLSSARTPFPPPKARTFVRLGKRGDPERSELAEKGLGKRSAGDSGFPRPGSPLFPHRGEVWGWGSRVRGHPAKASVVRPQNESSPRFASPRLSQTTVAASKLLLLLRLRLRRRRLLGRPLAWGRGFSLLTGVEGLRRGASPSDGVGGRDPFPLPFTISGNWWLLVASLFRAVTRVSGRWELTSPFLLTLRSREWGRLGELISLYPQTVCAHLSREKPPRLVSLGPDGNF